MSHLSHPAGETLIRHPGDGLLLAAVDTHYHPVKQAHDQGGGVCQRRIRTGERGGPRPK